MDSPLRMQLVRPLRWRDAWFCYRLAGEESTRMASLDTSRPTLIGHLRWMRRWMQPDRSALIITLNRKRVGLVRFDHESAEIGIAVMEKYRRQGIALDALKGATHLWWGASQPAPIRAIIRGDNVASIRLFGDAGYKSTMAMMYEMPNDDHVFCITMAWEPT